MQLRTLTLIALAALAAGAQARLLTCPKVRAETELFGTQCGTLVDQTGDDTGNWGAGRAGWITKLNVYADAKCVTGIKPTYGYDANNAKLLGREVGRGKDLRIWPASGEFITKIDIAAGKCVEYIKFYTNTGRTMSIGDAKSKVQTLTPPAGAHLFAFKGYYGPNCEAPAVMAVWGTEKCEEKKTVTAAVPVPMVPQEEPTPTPTPTPVPVPTPTPVPVPTPTPVPVPVPTPTPVPVPTPTPVAVPVPSPVPLPVPTPSPVPLPFPVPSPVPFPLPVPTPTPVPVPTPTPVPVPTPTPVPVPTPTPVPVPVPTPTPEPTPTPTPTPVPAPVDTSCKTVYFYGSSGLACDLTTNTVVQGNYKGTSPYVGLPCTDHGASTCVSSTPDFKAMIFGMGSSSAGGASASASASGAPMMAMGSPTASGAVAASTSMSSSSSPDFKSLFGKGFLGRRRLQGEQGADFLPLVNFISSVFGKGAGMKGNNWAQCLWSICPAPAGGAAVTGAGTATVTVTVVRPAAPAGGAAAPAGGAAAPAGGAAAGVAAADAAPDAAGEEDVADPEAPGGAAAGEDGEDATQ